MAKRSALLSSEPEQRGDPLERARRRSGGRWHPEPGAVVAGLGREQVGRLQLLGGAEHGDPVADVDLVVPARAGHRGRPVGRHHGDGGQGPEQGPEGGEAGHLHLGGHELGPAELDLVGVAAQAGLDDGRGGQGGHVEHGAGPGDVADGRADGGVGQLDHHPDVRPPLADQQGGLQGLRPRSARRRPRPGPAARPARSRKPPIRGLPTMKGISQASTIRTRRGSGSSSTTTTWTPAWWSCSTMRRPTPWRPHTMTWPSQSATGARSIPVWCPSSISAGLPECFGKKCAGRRTGPRPAHPGEYTFDFPC